ncbi:YajG family lipoprotein [Vibrio sp. RC27]
MKKLLVIMSIFLLTACASTEQAQIDLMPQATLSNSDIVRNKSFILTSKDVRLAQYVAIVDSGHSRVEPIHAKQNLRLTLENILAQQFESQGFSIVTSNNNAVTLSIDETLVTVNHSVMKNEINASVVLNVIAETPISKLVRTYTGTAKKTGALSASNDDIQLVLNDVLNLVLEKIANDQELQTYMAERF